MLGYSTHLVKMPEETGAWVAAKASSLWGAECTIFVVIFPMDVCCGRCRFLTHQDGDRRSSILGEDQFVPYKRIHVLNLNSLY